MTTTRPVIEVYWDVFVRLVQTLILVFLFPIVLAVRTIKIMVTIIINLEIFLPSQRRPVLRTAGCGQSWDLQAAAQRTKAARGQEH